MELYESFNHRGFTVNIYYDEDAESPRRAWDNLGTFYTAHRHYRPEEELDKHFDIAEIFEDKIGNFRQSFLNENIALPIYMYGHSGQTVSTTPFGYTWDCGFFGIVSVPVEKVKKEYGWKNLTKSRRKKIESYLQGEVESYDNYLTGEVYGYEIVETDNRNNEINSCWGFYGDDSIKHIHEETKAEIDAHILYEKIQMLKRFGRQLFIPFFEFPELTEENGFRIQLD